MKWSIRIGTILGVGVYLHFTFLLLLGFLGFLTWQSTGRIEAAIDGVVFISVLFGCVLLHEFGHALMARRFGIKTTDITLLPIGGVARLERMPEKPRQELAVALAGPAVNVIIGGLLLAWLTATNGFSAIEGSVLTHGSAGQRLMLFNFALVAFNLLPAFPMDGGRVLRALLATKLGRRRATAIAANVGQGMAILFGVVGFFYNPILIFIAVFVFLGAQAEAGLVEMQSILKGLRVRDAMMTRYRTLTTSHTIGQAMDELLAGSQQDFPVLAHEEPIGVLRRNDLVKALAERSRETLVSEIMCSECEPIEDSASLRQTMASMQARHCACISVVRDNRMVGLLSLENISEVLMTHAALEHHDGAIPPNQPHMYPRGSVSGDFSSAKPTHPIS